MSFLSEEQPDDLGPCEHCDVALYRVGSHIYAAGLVPCFQGCGHKAKQEKVGGLPFGGVSHDRNEPDVKG